MLERCMALVIPWPELREVTKYLTWILSLGEMHSGYDRRAVGEYPNQAFCRLHVGI